MTQHEINDRTIIQTARVRLLNQQAVEEEGQADISTSSNSFVRAACPRAAPVGGHGAVVMIDAAAAAISGARQQQSALFFAS